MIFHPSEHLFGKIDFLSRVVISKLSWSVLMSGFKDRMGKIKITNIRKAGPFDQVVTVEGGTGGFRKSPCRGCPWVKANDGSFPAEAFVHSAPTSYDMAQNRFGCHESGTRKPATCAGFLLRGADHNLSIRLDIVRGRLDPSSISDGGREMHESYKAMAIANGVPADAPELKACR